MVSRKSLWSIYLAYGVRFNFERMRNNTQALLDLAQMLFNVGVQKINGIMLDTYEIVVIAFLVTDTANWVRFFKKTFLVANVSPEIVFGMSFLILSNINVDFLSQNKEALPTTRHVKLMDKKKFATAAFDPEHETYVVHVRSVSSVVLPSSSLLKKFAAIALDPEHETYVVHVRSINSVAFSSSFSLDIHSIRRPQIAGLIVEKAPTKVRVKYADFANVFFPDLMSKLLEYTRINNQAIKLVDGQRPLYRPIYKIRASRTIQVICWRSGHCSSTKTVAFNCAS